MIPKPCSGCETAQITVVTLCVVVRDADGLTAHWLADEDRHVVRMVCGLVYAIDSPALKDGVLMTARKVP